MIQWLLLDRVDAEAAGTPVREELHAPVLDPAHEAQPALPLVHPTGAWTYVALHPTVGPHLPITGVNHRLLIPAVELVPHCLKLQSSMVGTLNKFPHSAILRQWEMNSQRDRT